MFSFRAVMVLVGLHKDVERGGGSREEKDLALETEEEAYSAARETPAGDKQSGLFARVQDLTGRFGVEQRGIERVLPSERTDTSASKVGTLVREPSASQPATRTRHVLLPA